VRVEVRNDLKAEAGDCVQLSVPMGSLMKLSLLVYFFPVVALIAGAIAAGAWAESFHMDASIASILGGGIAMGVTFCVLKWLDRRSTAKDTYQPRMIRILLRSDIRRSDPGMPSPM
jgi:sigma-E factor negative regulatory protein RseC